MVKRYLITNPYESVDWEKWDAYKAQLHVHTLASDGHTHIADLVEEHYKLDYDILAITDHAVLGVEWTRVPQTVPILRFATFRSKAKEPIKVLSTERAEEIKNGVGRASRRPMLQVTSGIELNGAVLLNTHVNGFFAEYGQSLIGVNGDYETPVRENGKCGGITFIDHPGYYTRAAKFKDASLASKEEYVNKFSRIFLDYPSCVGIDINSGRNTMTKYDRILYDNILKKTIPHGVLPWCFSFSDSHNIDQCDKAFTVHLMPELSVKELRRSMESGTFFAAARHARCELGDEFEGLGEMPRIKKISIDAQANTISIDAENYNKIVWVSCEKEIAEGASICVNEFENEIKAYVRAYIAGDGGVLYVQPFTVIEQGVTLQKEEIPKTNDKPTRLRRRVDIVDQILCRYNPLIILFKRYALGLTKKQRKYYYDIHKNK